MSILVTLFLEASFLAARRAAFDSLLVALAGLPGLEPAPVKSVAEKKVLRAHAEHMGIELGGGHWEAGRHGTNSFTHL